jgi:hypothetical protein
MKGYKIELAEHVEDLEHASFDGVPAADCYEVDPERGGFRLTESAKAQIAEANEEIARMERETVEKLDKAARDFESAERRFSTILKQTWVRGALVEHGCKFAMVDIATNLLLKKFDIELREDMHGEPSPVVMSPQGSITLDTAIQNWLASPEAEMCAPAKPTTPGPLAQRLQRILH